MGQGIVLTLFLIAISAGLSAAETCYEEGVNTKGRSQLGSPTKVGSWEECAKKCLLTSSCTYWTWANGGSGPYAFNCALMSAFQRKASDSNTVSGPKSCQAVSTCHEEGVNTKGRSQLGAPTKVGSWEECAKKCLLTSSCTYWTWAHGGSGPYAFNCALMSAFQGKASDSNTVSGPKSCQGSTNEGGLGVEAIPGTNSYVEYYPGNMNLMLSAPHGGKLKPFPSRVKDGSEGKWGGVSLGSDLYTKEIAMGVIKHFEDLTGRRPHFVVNNLHRSRLDPNRDEDVGTQGREEAVTAFREYHGFIDQAMLAAVPAQLKISSSGAGSTVQYRRMGDYYLSLKRYNGFPVYIKVDNSQVVFVNEIGNWVAFSKLDPKKRSLRNKDSGGASPSPPVRGWEYWDSGRSSWVSDPNMKVESLAPPYVTVSSSGAAASGQPARMGKYLLTKEIHNNYPVYKKEDKSQVMFVNNKKEWVIFHTIDPNVRSLRNKGGLTATPPRDGWQFWNKDSGRWNDDSKLRVDPPSALLLDIHGQAHGKNSTELGYLLKKAQLNADWYTAEETSIWGLIQRTGISVGQMMHGPKSLGAMFNDAGYKAFPSPDQESPGDDIYFSGGYTIGTHCSIDGGPVDGIQVEAPGELRNPKDKRIRDRFILALAQMFKRFYLQFYDN